jgi:hypothetical protein
MQIDIIRKLLMELAELFFRIVLARVEWVVRAQNVAQAKAEEMHIAVLTFLTHNVVTLITV